MDVFGVMIEMEYLLVATAAIAFLEAVARITPNDTDNKILAVLGKFLASLNIRKK